MTVAASTCSLPSHGRLPLPRPDPSRHQFIYRKPNRALLFPRPWVCYRQIQISTGASWEHVWHMSVSHNDILVHHNDTWKVYKRNSNGIWVCYSKLTSYKWLNPSESWAPPFKGIVVHPKMKSCWEFTHPQTIQDVDEFVSSSEQILRNLALHHLITLQWMGAVTMRVQTADKSITIMTPVHQLMS